MLAIPNLVQSFTMTIGTNMKNNYIAVIDTHIQGIPCKVGLTYFEEQKPYQGSLYSCPSDIDWYGYVDFDYDVLDQKGHKDDELYKKMTNEDCQRIYEDVMYARQKANEESDIDYDLIIGGY